MEIDKGVATLIAALLAAVLSGLTLLQKKSVEMREANRKYLETFVEELSDSIHQLMALSTIMLKNKTEESLSNTKVKSEKPKEKLKQLRTKIRYPLWGIDDAIQKLTRVTDFTLYTLKEPAVAKLNVKRAKSLANSIDKCIRNCYLHGRSPNFMEIQIIKFKAWRFTSVRNGFKEKRNT